ncbi:unnamed protein product [Protopolystoma xenopodis]|uniref:Uncharacterized protein n=1 Tax=Protopolystoma xenopodis TaxID=117903 RepID=A0A3S5BVD1_9PLAT|nr:unnamed protein product [Protopolystoma xenopodis]
MLHHPAWRKTRMATWHPRPQRPGQEYCRPETVCRILLAHSHLLNGRLVSRGSASDATGFVEAGKDGRKEEADHECLLERRPLLLLHQPPRRLQQQQLVQGCCIERSRHDTRQQHPWRLLSQSSSRSDGKLFMGDENSQVRQHNSRQNIRRKRLKVHAKMPEKSICLKISSAFNSKKQTSRCPGQREVVSVRQAEEEGADEQKVGII